MRVASGLSATSDTVAADCANVDAAEEADGLVSSMPFFAAAFDVAVFGTADIFISYGRGPPYLALAWDMISASGIVPDGFLFSGGDDGGVGCGTIPNDADAAEGAGLGVGALATSGMANGGAFGSLGRPFGFGGGAWGT